MAAALGVDATAVSLTVVQFSAKTWTAEVSVETPTDAAESAAVQSALSAFAKDLDANLDSTLGGFAVLDATARESWTSPPSPLPPSPSPAPAAPLPPAVPPLPPMWGTRGIPQPWTLVLAAVLGGLGGAAVLLIMVLSCFPRGLGIVWLKVKFCSTNPGNKFLYVPAETMAEYEMALRRRPVGWCAQFKGDKYLNYPNDPPPRAGAGLSNPRPMLIPPSSVWGALSTSGKTFAEEAREEAATIANGAKPPPMLGQIGRSTTLLVKPPVGGSAGSDFGFGSDFIQPKAAPPAAADEGVPPATIAEEPAPDAPDQPAWMAAAEAAKSAAAASAAAEAKAKAAAEAAAAASAAGGGLSLAVMDPRGYWRADVALIAGGEVVLGRGTHPAFSASERAVSRRQLVVAMGGGGGASVRRVGPNPSFVQHTDGVKRAQPTPLEKDVEVAIAVGDILWLSSGIYPMRLEDATARTAREAMQAAAAAAEGPTDPAEMLAMLAAQSQTGASMASVMSDAVSLEVSSDRPASMRDEPSGRDEVSTTEQTIAAEL